MLMYIARLTGIVAGLSVFMAGTLCAAGVENKDYSFTQAPYIHPKIIEDLSVWVSDRGEQVVAINLPESMDTNRYFGNIKLSGEEMPFIFYENTDECINRECPFGPSGFGYRFIGKTPAGIYVLMTESSGGGRGRFRNLMLVSLDKDKGLSYDKKNKLLRYDRQRVIINKLLELPLGDRYAGKISLQGDKLYIGKDSYTNGAGLFTEDTVLGIEAVH